MNDDLKAFEECFRELSPEAQEELKVLKTNLIIGMRMLRGEPSNMGDKGASELIGALVRVGVLPKNNPAAQRALRKNQRRWYPRR